MNTTYKNLLLHACSPGAIWDILRPLCDGNGGVQDLTIICGTRAARQSICLVRMTDRAEAEQIANSLGVSLFGCSEILFELELADAFGCARRGPGGEPPPTCVCQS